MKQDAPDVIAAGHLCLDMFPRFLNPAGQKIADLLRPGTLIRMGDVAFATGGPVSNTGVALQIFGCRVGFIAKVGDDAIGSIIVEILEKYGSAGGIRVARGETSSYTVVLAPPGVDRIFLHCPGANDTFRSADIDFALVRKARLFHLGYPTLMDSLHARNGRELVRIYAQARKTGVTTSMDISLPDPNSAAGRANWATIYRKVLPYVDIFVPSIEEAFFTLNPREWARRREKAGGEDLVERIRPDEFSAIASRFLDMGCAIVVLKAGPNGWYLRTASAARLARMGRLQPRHAAEWANIELWCPAFEAKKIASATGSGDSSIAGFLAAMLRGKSPIACVKMANCAGWMNLRAMDALGGLRSWREMETAAPRLKVRDVPMLRHARWKWNAHEEVWRR